MPGASLSESPETTAVKVQSTVLVVDDDASTRLAMSYLLEMEGYEVVSAENGVEAPKIVTRARPALVLSDVRMPGMDGEELAAELKARGGPPVILLTAHALIDEKRAAEVGAAGLIHKPVDLGALTDLLEKVLAETDVASNP